MHTQNFANQQFKVTTTVDKSLNHVVISINHDVIFKNHDVICTNHDVILSFQAQGKKF